MKTSELVRYIKKHGCKLERQGSNHELWINPKTGQRTQVPRHSSHEIPTGTVNNILKALGLK